MNILKIKFSGNTRFGYDDEISSKRRNAIREHINNTCLYNVDIFQNEGRLEPDKLNKLIYSLVNDQQDIFERRKEAPLEVDENKEDGVVEIDHEIMKELPAYNVEPIWGTESYRGGASCLNDRVCSMLKQAGIKRVVFLRPDPQDEENQCEKYGLDSMVYRIDNSFSESAMFKTREMIIRKADYEFDVYGRGRCLETREDIRNYHINFWENAKKQDIKHFIEFIQTMQKDNVYVGCISGTEATDNALMLNDFFNPKMQDKPRAGRLPDEICLWAMADLYNNLTEEDKQKLGWDGEFERSFILKINERCKYLGYEKPLL